MAELDSKKMDDAAKEALQEFLLIQEKYPDGLKETRSWVNKWFAKAGYKRLAKIIAGRQEEQELAEIL